MADTAAAQSPARASNMGVPPPPPMSHTERVWLIVKLNPGIPAYTIAEQAKSAAIPSDSISSLIAQLQAQKRIEKTGNQRERPGTGRLNDCYRARGESRNPAVKEWLEALTAAQNDDTAADTPDGVVVALPLPPASDKPKRDESWRHNPRVMWKPPEWEAFLAKAVRDEIMQGVKINTAHLLKISGEEGHGYRPRKMHAIPGGLDGFLGEHAQTLARLRADMIGKQWTAQNKPPEQEAAAAPAQAAADAAVQETAHDADTLAERVQPLANEIGPVRELGADIALEDEPQTSTDTPAVPSAPPADSPLAMIMQGATLIVRGLVQDIVRQELSDGLAHAQAEMVQSIEALFAKGFRDALAIQAGAPNAPNFMEQILRPRVVLKTSPTQPSAQPASVQPKSAPRKPQVIVVGGLSAQFDSVRAAFPMFDIRLVTGRVPSEQDPDLVVGVTKFLDHALERSMKKKYGDAYLPVHGSATVIKQAIASRMGVPISELH